MPTLTPALELEAVAYATRERPLPEESGKENPQGWHRYWADSLADAGIFGLEELPMGYSLVTLSSLTDPSNLRIILRHSLKKVIDWDLEDISTFYGGYVLQHEGRWIAPSCCGDLSNLDEWCKAAAYTEDKWSMVWIGHPWTHVRAEGDMLYFAEPSETCDTDLLTQDYALCLSRQSLLAAIETARAERQAFGERLLPLIADLYPPVPANKVLEILLMGHHCSTPT